MKLIVIFIIKFYQFFISPWLGKNCRYMPTCSEYTIEAIKDLGLVRGLFISIKRILRCNPFASSGYDPVPDKVLINTIKYKEKICKAKN